MSVKLPPLPAALWQLLRLPIGERSKQRPVLSDSVVCTYPMYDPSEAYGAGSNNAAGGAANMSLHWLGNPSSSGFDLVIERITVTGSGASAILFGAHNYAFLSAIGFALYGRGRRKRVESISAAPALVTGVGEMYVGSSVGAIATPALFWGDTGNKLLSATDRVVLSWDANSPQAPVLLPGFAAFVNQATANLAMESVWEWRERPRT